MGNFDKTKLILSRGKIHQRKKYKFSHLKLFSFNKQYLLVELYKTFCTVVVFFFFFLMNAKL